MHTCLKYRLWKIVLCLLLSSLSATAIPYIWNVKESTYITFIVLWTTVTKFQWLSHPCTYLHTSSEYYQVIPPADLQEWEQHEATGTLFPGSSPVFTVSVLLTSILYSMRLMLGRTVADPEKWKERWLKWPPQNFLLIKYSLGHVNCFVSIHMLLQLSVFYCHHEEPCLSDWFASHHTLGLKERFVQVNQRVLKQWHCTPKGPPIHLPGSALGGAQYATNTGEVGVLQLAAQSPASSRIEHRFNNSTQ